MDRGCSISNLVELQVELRWAVKMAVDPAAKASMKMQEAAPAGVEDDGQWPAVLDLGQWLVAAVAEMAAATAASTMAEAVPAMVMVAAVAPDLDVATFPATFA